MVSQRLRQISPALKPLGIATLGGCLAWATWSADLSSLTASPELLTLTALAAALCSVGAIVQGLGYGHAARATGLDTLPSDGLAIFGAANPAKYVPGNVFHLVGRQVLAYRRGWPQSVALAATLIEAAGLVGLSLLGAAILLGAVLLWAWVWVLLVTATICAGVWAWRDGIWRVNGVLDFFGLEPLCRWELLWTALYLGAFLFATSVSAVAIAGQIGLDAPWHLIVGAWLASYAVGIVTPLAPGGLFAREGAMVAVAGVVGLDPALAGVVAGIMRLVTLAAEAVLWVVSAAVMASRPDVEPEDTDGPDLGELWRRLVDDAKRKWRCYRHARACGLQRRLAYREAMAWPPEEPELARRLVNYEPMMAAE